MQTETTIAIKDACIIIDLIELHLMDAFYKLGFNVYTTAPVIAEITDIEQMKIIKRYIESGDLLIDNDGMFNSIGTITEQYPGLSFADSSVLEVALRRDCMVLSCDASLRKIATNKNLVVRGVLWVIEELCSAEIMTVEAALEKLNLYSVVNNRAPKKEIKDLIGKLNNSN